MVTDNQVRRLMKLMQTEKTYAIAAAKAGMDEKTARKYRRIGKLPSELKKERTWRTRKDPFEAVWDEIKSQLEINPGLESKTLFEDLQRRYPGRFFDGQLRTLQRRIKIWRATKGPGKEVYFPQKHQPGKLCQSDFTHMSALGVTINGQRFDHLLYHFVLTYSNWEAGTICFSESFESLSEGLQNALWELGGVPQVHQTDRLTPAVQKTDHPEEFTRRYAGLLSHYGLEGRKSQSGKAHELGDVEQRHYRFKKAVDQALMLRGSRDFTDRDEYTDFLRKLFSRLNAGRRERLLEEQKLLRPLPNCRLEACKKLQVKVGPSSTIRANHNVYSVPSQLIGERVQIRLYVDHLEVWYGQKCVDTLPRLRGEGRHAINYRHIIDWLIRKPGAFANYRYRKDLFPTSRFRMAYDALKDQHTLPVAVKQYLKILYLAARENETAADDALRWLFDHNLSISVDAVRKIILSGQKIEPVTELTIPVVELAEYDMLLTIVEAA